MSETTGDKLPIYIHLFHGRKTPDEQLEDWGHDGPVLGPFPFAHITYNTDIKLDNEAFHELRFVDDLLYYDGVYYGDWSVTAWPPKSPEAYEQEKSEPPSVVAVDPADSKPSPEKQLVEAMQEVVREYTEDERGSQFSSQVASTLRTIGKIYQDSAAALVAVTYGSSGNASTMTSVAEMFERMAKNVEENGSA